MFSIVAFALPVSPIESVSVKSYGAVGNALFVSANSTPVINLETETLSLRRAAVDVANVTNVDPDWKPRALTFPAGVYAVNDSHLTIISCRYHY